MKQVRRFSSVLLIVCLLLSFATHVQASDPISDVNELLIYSDFHEWNAEMTNYNCYAYAIGYKVDGEWKSYNPGFKCGLSYNHTADISEMAFLVAEDLRVLGNNCILQQTNRPTSLGNWSNIIAMRKDTTYDVLREIADGIYEPFNDYHFAKMKSDGWYHKPSITAVLKFRSAPNNGTIWTNECIGTLGHGEATVSYDSDIIYMSYKGSHGTLVRGEWTGNDRHLENKHSYEFERICPDCSKVIDTEWVELPCRGPTCVYPWSVEPEHEVS